MGAMDGVINQDLCISLISNKLSNALQNGIYEDSAQAKEFLKEIQADLSIFLEDGIDFKKVVNSLDDSILITDSESKVIYVNPNYKVNTGIDPALILGRKVSDIVAEGKIFTGGAVMDVIKTRKKAFRLSDVRVTNPPQTGYVIGVPIFDDAGDLRLVVASSRPILTLRALHEDFEQFLEQANALKHSDGNIKIVQDANETDFHSSKLIGNSTALKKIWIMVQNAAPTDATVLITGESGVGKEVIADEIYRMSNRNDKPFIKVNCASIPLNLLESELFGYEKGAFSGANANGKQGLFEMANGGTLLLDEIGDMPMDLQVKLLRAIQNREITRVGGTKPIPLDIRFIAATNSDLKKKIAEGTFRQDLYYRLNVIPVQIPPLRERKEDIILICKHFINMYSRRHGRNALNLTESLYEILMTYDWPGNIRELENVIEYLTICAPSSGAVDEAMLLGILDIRQNDDLVPSVSETLNESMEKYEKNLIETVLRNSRSLRDAGAKLGVNASTLSRKIRQYGIDYPGSESNR